MLLNNYWNLKYLCDTSITPYSIAETETVRGVKYENGNAWERITQINSGTLTSVQEDLAMKKHLRLELGSSPNTTIDPAQYAIDNRIDSNFTNYTCTYTTTVSNNNKIKTIFTVGGVNNTNASITITQVAIIKQLLNSSGARNNNTWTVLAINNLDDPITVPAGQGFSLVYEWTEQ